MRNALFAALILVLFSLSCESEECAKMRQCCQSIDGEEWVGDACGAITSDVDDSRSCAAVSSAIEVAAQDRGAELPASCK